MTRVCLDDAPVDGLSDAHTIGDVLASVRDRLREQDRIVTSFLCDGTDVVGDDLTAVLTRPLANVNRIDFRSESQSSAVQAVLRQARESVLDMRGRREPIADLLAEGRVAEAMQALGAFMRTWSQTLAAVEQSAALLGLSLTDLPAGDASAEVQFTDIADALRRLKLSLASQDYVLVADQMRFEMSSTLDAWDDVFGALIADAESRDAPSSSI